MCGSSRTSTPRSYRRATVSVGFPRGRNETSVLWPGSLTTVSPASRSSSPQRSASARARSKRPAGCPVSAASSPASEAARREARIEAGGARLRLPGSGRDVVALGARGTTTRRCRSASGIADVEPAARVRPAQPLLGADRVVVRRRSRRPRSRRPTARRRPAPARRSPRAAPRHGNDLAVEPGDRRERDQPRARRDLGRARGRRSRRPAARAPARCDRSAPGAEQRAGEPEVLRRRSSRPRRPAPSPRPTTTIWTPCVVEFVSAIRSAGTPTCAAISARTRSRRASISSKYGSAARPFSASQARSVAIASSVSRGERPDRAGVQVGVPVRGRESARARSAQFIVRHPPPRAHDPTARRHRARDRPPARCARGRRAAPRTRTWSMPGPGGENPHSRRRARAARATPPP